MRRREFVTLLAGAAINQGWSRAGNTQPSTTPRIGYLSSRSAEADAPFFAAFLRGMNEAGSDQAKIDSRWADNQPPRLETLAAELVASKPAVILAGGGSGTARVLQRLTSTVPIVFVNGADPVRAGLVQSLNKPGGNVTGVSFLATQIVAKRLELLRSFIPDAKRIAVLANPENADSRYMRGDLDAAEKSFNLTAETYLAATETELDSAFLKIEQHGPRGLLISGDTFFNAIRRKVIAFCLKERLPSIFDVREYATEGGLMSYGTSQTGAYRQAGKYVAVIAHGGKPADLPVMQSTKFELIINRNTAKALNLEIPTSLAALADEIVD